MSDELKLAMAELDEEKTLSLAEEKIRSGYKPMEIMEICQRGVEIVGHKYSEGEYFLSDLIMSEEILRGVMRIVEPHIPVKAPSNDFSIVMGTIEGDIHDLGKNIMIYALRSAGFRVYDLGVDVAPEKFVQAIHETGATILGISVLLTFCVGAIKKVVDLLQETGLRAKVKVVIGGYPVNQIVQEYTGADYCTNDITQALAIIRRILGRQSQQLQGMEI